MLTILAEAARPETIYGIAMETRIFLLSCAVGAGLGVFYDVFRLFRVLVPQGKRAFGKTAVLIEDIIYFLFSALCYFIFITETAWGSIRLFIFIGMLIGFFTEHFTVGNLIVGALRGFVKWLYKRLFYPVMKGIAWIFTFINNKTVKNLLNFIKSQKNARKRLKLAKSMVYNEDGLYRRGSIKRKHRHGQKNNKLQPDSTQSARTKRVIG